MKIEFFSQNISDFPADLFVLFLLWTFFWLYAIARILSRPDYDTATRILWTMVVIFVPIFGVFFYWFLSPSPAGSRSGRNKTNGPVNLMSDVAGTPWANNPSHTQEN